MQWKAPFLSPLSCASAKLTGQNCWRKPQASAHSIPVHINMRSYLAPSSLCAWHWHHWRPYLSRVHPLASLTFTGAIPQMAFVSHNLFRSVKLVPTGLSSERLWTRSCLEPAGYRFFQLSTATIHWLHGTPNPNLSIAPPWFCQTLCFGFSNLSIAEARNTFTNEIISEVKASIPDQVSGDIQATRVCMVRFPQKIIQ